MCKYHFHKIRVDQNIGGLTVGTLGALNFILCPDTRRPQTDGYHDFFISEDTLMGSLGATEEKVLEKLHSNYFKNRGIL